MFLLECMLHNVGSMWRKEHRRCSQGSQSEMAKSAPEHPSVGTLLGSPDSEIPKVAEQVYSGECVVAPSVHPCRQQDECMRELHKKLTRHITRAGLQSETGPARPSYGSWRCSHSHSTSQT